MGIEHLILSGIKKKAQAVASDIALQSVFNLAMQVNADAEFDSTEVVIIMNNGEAKETVYSNLEDGKEKADIEAFRSELKMCDALEVYPEAVRTSLINAIMNKLYASIDLINKAITEKIDGPQELGRVVLATTYHIE